MTDKNSENSNHLNSLLNTYSIKEISGLFTQIDNNLISLHKCSADDFLRLNSSFKEIYNQSKQISKNVIDVLDVFNASKNNSLTKEIDSLYEKLKAQFEILDYKIVVVYDQFEKLSNQIRHIFFPIKNYSQNLMSLNYLIANLKVSFSYDEKHNKQVEKASAQTESLIYKIKLLTDEVSNSLNLLSKNAKKSQITLNRIQKSGDINLEDLLSEIRGTLNTIENQNEKNEKVIPQIEDEIKESETSISEIIKKLQYQDIIRQKMEHIQHTHKDLIDELIQFNTSNLDTEKLSEKVQCFMRIRDISGLQAAQLIHANKEYQSAIEVIINHFIQIGDNTKSVIEKCKNVYTYGNSDYTVMYENISSYISKAILCIDNLTSKNEILEEEIDTVYNSYLQAEKNINKFQQQMQLLEDSLITQKDILNSIITDDNALENVKIQFSHLFDETKNIKEKINSLFQNLFLLKKNVEGFANKTDASLLVKSDFSEFKDMLQSFKISGKEINQKLEENNYISKSILRNIKKSISKIEYYDYFENIIQGIISELNTINFKLKIGDTSQDISKEENLEKLKQYYTMQTEHFIHDQIAKGEDFDIDFNIDGEDEIEFF